MSLIVFLASWVLAWAACWYGLSRVRVRYRTVTETSRPAMRKPASLLAPPRPDQLGGVGFMPAGPLTTRTYEVLDEEHAHNARRRAARWAPVLATLVAFAVSALTGGLFSW